MSINKRVRALKRAGYIIEYTNSLHLKVTHPTKPGTVFLPGTPGDHRNDKIARAKLRRQFHREEYAEPRR